jgi:quinol monooxygenase YgiN
MPMHFFVRFEPKPAKEKFREALLRVNGLSRAEPGCVAIALSSAVKPRQSWSA